MITGSERKSIHRIDEVVLDFSFDGDAAQDTHSDRLAAWVVDEFLPLLETVLDAYDDADSILRIERVAIDLGDVEYTNYTNHMGYQAYSVQLVNQSREQLERILDNVNWRKQPLAPSVLRPPPFASSSLPLQINQAMTHAADADTDADVQWFTVLQSDLETLHHFLMSGNMPWHVDTTGTRAHRQLVERILHAADGARMLRSMLLQYTPVDRETAVRRLVYQFPQPVLSEILISFLSPQQHDLPGLIHSVHKRLAQMSLTNTQCEAAMTALWVDAFKQALDDGSPANGTPPATITSMLHKAAVAAACDKNLFIQQLGYSPDLPAPGLRGTFAESTIDSVKRPLPATSISKSKTPADYANNLFERFFNALAASNLAEIDLAGLMSARVAIADVAGAEKHSGSSTIRRQVLALLNASTPDNSLIHELSTHVPDTVLLDLVFLVSPNAAVILEQQMVQIASMASIDGVQSDMDSVVTTDAWKQRFWNNALQYVAKLPDQIPGNDVLDSHAFVRAALRHVFDDRTGRWLLRQSGPIRAVPMQQVKTKDATDTTQQSKHAVTDTAARFNLFAVGIQANWADQQSLEAGRVDAPQPATLDTHTNSASNPYADAVERLRAVFHQTARQPVDQYLIHQSKPHQTEDAENSSEDRLIFERHLQTHPVSDQWTLQRFLTAMLQDASMPANVIDSWPLTVLQDIVYRLSPWNAVTLAAVAQLAEAARVQTESLYADASVGPEEASGRISNRLVFLLYRSALEVLLDADVAKPDEWLEQSVEKESESMYPHAFVTAVFRQLACAPDGIALIRLLQVSIPQHQQYTSERIADQAYIIQIVKHSLQIVLPAVEQDYDSDDQSIATERALQQEITVILATLPDDYVTQKRRLQSFFITHSPLTTNDGVRIDTTRLAELAKALIRYNPELTVSDSETLIESITNHAGKADNPTRYYRHVLDALLSDKLLDLDALAATKEGTVRTERLTKSAHARNTATADYFIHLYQRTVPPVIYAAAHAAGSDSTPEKLLAGPLTRTTVRQRLMALLDAKVVRTALAENLPQSVLLDIVYLLSPPAAIALEQLLQHVAAIKQTDTPDKADNLQSAAFSNDKQRIWQSALNCLYSLCATDSDALDVPVFMRAVFSSWVECGIIPAASDRTQPYSYPVPAIQTLLEVVLANADVQADNPPTDLTTGLERLDSLVALGSEPKPVTETVFAILAALPSDLEAQRQRLQWVLHDKNRRTDSLSHEVLQTLVYALVSADPRLDSDNRRMFVDAIANHAQYAADTTLFYRRLLEQLVADRETDPSEPIDLEALAQLSQPKHADLDTNTARPADDVHRVASTVAIYQRVLQAMSQMQHDTATQVRQPLVPELVPQAPATSAVQMGEALWSELQDTVLRQRCVTQLPQAVLLDMAFILSPSAALVLEQVLEQAAALQHTTAHVKTVSAVSWKQQLWEAALDFLTGQRAPDAGSPESAESRIMFESLSALSVQANVFDLPAFVLALIRAVAHNQTVATVVQEWLQVFSPLPGGRILVHVLNTLLLRRDELARGVDAATGTASASAATPVIGTAQPVQFDYEYRTDETFFIDNAGQVLAAPYLPRLFRLLELTDDDAFVDHAAAERAVHLLQFMVKGEQDCAEYQLLLNKLLCGVSTGVPVQSRIVLSRQERDTVDDLIRGMIQNWKTIGNTSVAGLRETFLQRRGQLVLQEDIWFLTIEPGAFDMLLDNLPWRFSVIKHRWMERAIHVTWR